MPIDGFELHPSNLSVRQVYNDFLTDYEKMCFVLGKLEDCINEINGFESDTNIIINTQNTTINNYIDLYTELKEYVNNYFNNLDVQNEVNIKINSMELDGTLDNIINHTIFNNFLSVGIPIENYIKQTGETDDTGRFNRAILDCIANNATLLLGNKTYKISRGLVIIGSLNIIGNGSNSIIESNDITKPVIKITGASDIVLKNFKIVSSGLIRDNVNHGLFISGNKITVDNLSIYNTGATGIFSTQLNDSTIINCNIGNTLADGIHITGMSKNILVNGNNIINSGDDSIATVSYTSDVNYCDNIIITNNIINSSKSRGVSNVGSRNVTISNNIINNTSSSGVIVFLDNAYATFAPYNTIIENNQIKGVGSIEPLVGNQFGIEVTSESVLCIVNNNIITSSTGRGINIAGAKNIVTNNNINTVTSNQIEYQKGCIISNNNFENCVVNGLSVINSVDVVLNNNIFHNNNTSSNANGDNLYMDSCSKITITGNVSIDDNTTPKVRNAMTLYNSTDIEISNNIIDCGNLDYSFPASTKILLKDGIITNSDASNLLMFKAGQEWFNTSNLKKWFFDGTAWRYYQLI